MEWYREVTITDITLFYKYSNIEYIYICLLIVSEVGPAACRPAAIWLRRSRSSTRRSCRNPPGILGRGSRGQNRCTSPISPRKRRSPAPSPNGTRNLPTQWWTCITFVRPRNRDGNGTRFPPFRSRRLNFYCTSSPIILYHFRRTSFSLITIDNYFLNYSVEERIFFFFFLFLDDFWLFGSLSFHRERERELESLRRQEVARFGTRRTSHDSATATVFDGQLEAGYWRTSPLAATSPTPPLSAFEESHRVSRPNQPAHFRRDT